MIVAIAKMVIVVIIVIIVITAMIRNHNKNVCGDRIWGFPDIRGPFGKSPE